MKEYLAQVIFCSDRVGRAFRREITFTQEDAMVTNVEVLPPEYHHAVERFRDVDEKIVRFRGRLKHREGMRACPLCGNLNYFICECGILSCMTGEKREHVCPGCRMIFVPTNADHSPFSKSGLVHGRSREQVVGNGPQVVEERPRLRGPRPLELPAPEKAEARSKLKKFLEDKRKGD